MSRASQSLALQATAIVLSILLVLLGTSTFLLWRKTDELRLVARSAQDEASQDRAAARSAVAESGEVKRLLGFRPGEDLDRIRSEFAKDMERCGAKLPEQSRFYRPALAYAQDLVQARNAELARAHTQIAELDKAYAARQYGASLQVEQIEKVAVAANGRAERAGQTAKEAEQQRVAESENFRDLLKALRAKGDQASAAAAQQIEQLQTQRQDLWRRCQELEKRIEDLERVEFTAAQGRITYVSQPLHKAWIDLGTADLLRPLVRFNVYPAQANNLSSANQKGRIEVSQVQGDHVAVTDVVEEKPADPMIPGDKIHSLKWRAGQ
jgi:hypothetical protein